MVTKNIENVSTNTYNVTWLDDTNGKTVFESIFVITDSENIDTVSDTVYTDFINNTTLPEVDPSEYLSLSEYKEYRKDEVTDKRLDVFSSGFTYAGHIYDIDEVSRLNIVGTVGAVSAGLTLPEGFTWRTKDNSSVPMGNTDVLELGAAALTFTVNVYGVSFYHKDNIDNLTTNTDIKNYDITVAWPT